MGNECGFGMELIDEDLAGLSMQGRPILKLMEKLEQDYLRTWFHFCITQKVVVHLRVLHF